ncbi:acyl-coenzyme A thioesterase PaaI-like protein [Desulfitispora alkaliphila]|uniref:transcription factor FapR n=1 Tax=Desulfitispora alkaliphila TaxID=622674 RepID=UPI003D2360EE
MGEKRLSKNERHNKIQNQLRENPFYTDEDLSQMNNVSVQTIRLDRMEMQIPELRERIKNVAEQNYNQVKSLHHKELIGELLELELDESGMSLLIVTKEMVLKKAGIVRGHHLFAQANSLAVAILDSDIALTGGAEVKYINPVNLNDKVICYGKVIEKVGEKYKVSITSKVNGKEVFTGNFTIFARREEDVK